MYAVFGEVMDGSATDAQKSAFLIALRMKGETAEEITGAALAMRERVTPLAIDDDDLVDTCGTGGDGRGTFNVSTVAAIVAAAAGANVAKHGNRAVSSSCGSADILTALGVDIDLDAAQMSRGAAAHRHRRSSSRRSCIRPWARWRGVRRELGVRTIFNVLGPLTNPAFAQAAGPRRLRRSSRRHPGAASCWRSAREHALVVHSRDGLDEISVSAPTHVCEVIGRRDPPLRPHAGRRRRAAASRSSEIAGGDAADERAHRARGPRRRRGSARATSSPRTPAPRCSSRARSPRSATAWRWRSEAIRSGRALREAARSWSTS